MTYQDFVVLVKLSFSRINSQSRVTRNAFTRQCFYVNVNQSLLKCILCPKPWKGCHTLLICYICSLQCFFFGQTLFRGFVEGFNSGNSC